MRSAFLKLCFIFILFYVCSSLTPFFSSSTIAYAATKPKSPSLSLNISQGPLGATLTLKGKNFRAGLMTISYVDANNAPGIFAAPSDNQVQVQRDGTFTLTNIILPSNGPAGTWKIVVMDSQQQTVSTDYHVLAVAGATTAGTPTLTFNPPNGKIGDVIAFSGENWFPQGTRVNLQVVTDTATLPLLDAPVASAKDGTIMGAFHIPSNLNSAQTVANLRAVDSNNALHAQGQLSLASALPTPTLAPTPLIKPTAVKASGNTPPVSLQAFFRMDAASILILALIIGVTLGLAGFMLLLFMMPWGNRRRQGSDMPPSRSGQW